MNTAQVRWFAINPTLADDSIASQLGPDVTHEAGKPPLLFFRGGRSIGCRSGEGYLKINLSEEEILQTARRIGDCLGES